MAKRRKQKKSEVDALLDHLVEGLSPEEVMGREGRLESLQKGIMEWMRPSPEPRDPGPCRSST